MKLFRNIDTLTLDGRLVSIPVLGKFLPLTINHETYRMKHDDYVKVRFELMYVKGHPFFIERVHPC